MCVCLFVSFYVFLCVLCDPFSLFSRFFGVLVVSCQFIFVTSNFNLVSYQLLDLN